MIVGNSGFNSKSRLTAALPIYKKEIFCIDNVDKETIVADIRNFVESLSVRVMSCFEAKPRKRRGESDDDVSCRKAFRLCICSDDRERLLDDSQWPAFISVYQWFFKGQQSQPTGGATSSISTPSQRQRTTGQSVARLLTSASTSVNKSVNINNNEQSTAKNTTTTVLDESIEEQSDMDTTIIISEDAAKNMATADY